MTKEQKDASKAIEAVERIDKYIDEHVANAHDMKDSHPDKKYYRGWDDALGKMAGILQDVYSGEKQKEQKPAEQNTREQIVSKAATERQVVLISESNNRAEINWDTRSLEDTKALLKWGLAFINEQLGIKSSGPIPQPKECEPVEWNEKDKETLIKVEQIVSKHWNSLSDSFYHKYDDENQDAESCYNWLKSLPERFVLQSRQEWSEEDSCLQGGCSTRQPLSVLV